MKVLQVLPNLNSGGVERGTVEFARELVRQGHESIVMSNGGRLVAQLESEGSSHIQLPVHRKSLWSLRLVRPVRKLLQELKPDIIHVRSRAPAWIIWLAWRKLPAASRPRLVSTFHGLYSVNFYSAVMAKAEHIIAISQCVEKYIKQHYCQDEQRITVIPRGVDVAAFAAGAPPDAWSKELYRQYPQLREKHIILMPGRLSRWKGQETFLTMMQQIIAQNPRCHGVIVGDAEPKKVHYRRELEAMATELQLDEGVTFVGHRSDIAEFYRLADIVCHMSSQPEPFGRTLTEALATNTPVVAFDRGGASESLSACFPAGLVPADDVQGFAEKVLSLLGAEVDIKVQPEFHMQHQIEATISVYQRLLAVTP
ncbi:glycosyltransferase family 4 protein [Simiduia litorea]|uniref:glycosyltransferase family 4 protein n=1 Tax=Simiduia litorea TaxID=1435348 RepID=UPI0036F3E8AF